MGERKAEVEVLTQKLVEAARKSGRTADEKELQKVRDFAEYMVMMQGDVDQ